MRTMNSKKKRGFTLVELLVVITVIGILMSLAFPAISSAMASVRTKQCANNIKQIGIGYKSFIASGQNPMKLKARCWPMHLLPHMDDNLAVLKCPLPDNQFIITEEMLEDPDDKPEKGSAHDHSESRLIENGKKTMCSYGMNSRAHKLGGSDPNKVLALEYRKLDARVAESKKKDDWAKSISDGHARMINVVFMDGSIKSIGEYEVNPSSSSVREKYWQPYSEQD